MSGLPWSDRDKLDPEDAKTRVFLARDMLQRLHDEEVLEKQCALLAIAGYYPYPKTKRDVALIEGALRRVAFRPRSQGIQ